MSDRRKVPRGGRRLTDQNGFSPLVVVVEPDATRADLTETVLSRCRFAVAPVVSNHDAVAYDDADGWRDRLPAHVSVPVRWRSTMHTLVGLGATTLLEVGHGSMLAALAKRGAPSVTVRNVATPEDIPTIMEVA